MSLRQATIFDCSYICAMLYRMHEESEFDLDKINAKKLSETVLGIINNGVVFVAIDEDERIIGSVGGSFFFEWWSDEKILGDLWFYVYKSNRSSTAAIDLIRRFIKAGNGVKMKLGHIYSGDLERKDKFYERLGLKKAGSTYVMETI